jgi:DNA-binding CsgD family transcriptional regulator
MASPQIEYLREIGPTQATDTGIVLLADSPVRPVYANAAAIQILTYPHNPKMAGLDRFITNRIRAIVSGGWSADKHSSVMKFVSGRRRYSFRAFSLELITGRDAGTGAVADRPAIAVLLQRSGSGIDPCRIAEHFHLTAREHETIRFLALGLTNKDIANRMHVSPNTVKAMLRTIMFKTGASTRSGIVGKCPITRQ